MKSCTLTRFASCQSMGTFGQLVVHGTPLVYQTVEAAWHDNARDRSCIPLGVYRMVWGRYNRGGYETYTLAEVPGRSDILFHAANVGADLKGCIAVGTMLGVMYGQWAVLESRKALDEMCTELQGDETVLKVRARDLSSIMTIDSGMDSPYPEVISDG